MYSRKLNSDISYPFIPEVPDRNYISGIMDIQLTIAGSPTGDLATSYKPYYAYLYSITQGSSVTTYVFYAVTVLKYYRFTFNVPWSMGMGSVQNSTAEEARGVLMINATYIYKGGNLVLSTPSYELEPGTQIWLEKQIRSINFINEYRNFDPTQRTDLTNTLLKQFKDSDDISLGSGYNAGLNYSSGILTVDGNIGNGEGLTPDNMWDTGPSWSSSDGLYMVNGVIPNADGDIPIDKSASVGITQKAGELGVNI